MNVGFRALIGIIAVSFFAQGAFAQVLCEKVNKKGKAKYKIRTECLVQKGETVATLGGDSPEPARLFHTSTEETTNVSGPTLVQLSDDVGGDPTIFQFDTTATSTEASITFSADCGLEANGTSGFFDIDVVVDGVPLFPLANGATRFCQIGDEILGTSPVSAATEASSYTVVAEDLTPGSHAVSIAMTPQSGVTGAIQRPVLAIATFPNPN